MLVNGFCLADESTGVTLHCPAKVVDVVRTAESARVTLDDGQQLTAKLLVAADGSHSALAQSCAIQWQRQDYQQVAVIANITTSELPNGRAFERFTRNGPLALLPMSQGRSSLVWCHAKHDQQQIDSWDDARFWQSYSKPLAGGWGKCFRRVNATATHYSY